MDTKDKIINWFLSGDTGLSSKAIVATMVGANETACEWGDHPRDIGDFGRCYRLLKVVPDFRSRISEMSSRSPKWAALVEHWDELSYYYEMQDNKKLKKCLKKALDIDH